MIQEYVFEFGRVPAYRHRYYYGVAQAQGYRAVRAGWGFVFFGHFQFPGRIGYKFGWSHKIRHRQIQECQIQHRQETTISPQE